MVPGVTLRKKAGSRSYTPDLPSHVFPLPVPVWHCRYSESSCSTYSVAELRAIGDAVDREAWPTTLVQFKLVGGSNTRGGGGSARAGDVGRGMRRGPGGGGGGGGGGDWVRASPVSGVVPIFVCCVRIVCFAELS